MEIKVVNRGIDYRGVSTTTGAELAIKFGEGKPADDKSMNPVEMLGASLCMCIAAMLRKFLGSHNLQSEEIRVDLVGDWEPGDPGCENIKITVEVAGDWDAQRKAAFLKVAETCPVHHTMAECGEIEMTVV